MPVCTVLTPNHCFGSPKPKKKQCVVSGRRLCFSFRIYIYIYIVVDLPSRPVPCILAEHERMNMHFNINQALPKKRQHPPQAVPDPVSLNTVQNLIKKIVIQIQTQTCVNKKSKIRACKVPSKPTKPRLAAKVATSEKPATKIGRFGWISWICHVCPFDLKYFFANLCIIIMQIIYYIYICLLTPEIVFLCEVF